MRRLLIVAFVLAIGGCQIPIEDGATPSAIQATVVSEQEECELLRPAKTTLAIGDQVSEDEVLSSIVEDYRVPLNTINSERRYRYVRNEEVANRYSWKRNTEEYSAITEHDVVALLMERWLSGNYDLENVLKCYGEPAYYAAWFDRYLSYPNKWAVIFLFYPDQGVVVRIEESWTKSLAPSSDELLDLHVESIVWSDESTTEGLSGAYSQAFSGDDEGYEQLSAWLTEHAVPWPRDIQDLVYVEGDYPR